MIKILLRADDLGYSEAVNYGMAKSVLDGLINNVGVMVNMPATEHGVKLLEDATEVAFGLHTNISAGKPITDPKLIPSLVDEYGYFKSSKVYRNATKDFVVLEEVKVEIEAQYEKFLELFGRKPDYFEGHAVASQNFFKGLEQIADKYQLKYSGMSVGNEVIRVGDSDVKFYMGSVEEGYEPFTTLKQMVDASVEDVVSLMVLHPGYLDAYILKNSTLTYPRVLEVEMSIDPATDNWIKENNVQLVTYKEL